MGTATSRRFLRALPISFIIFAVTQTVGGVAACAAEIGSNDFRISDMGATDGDAAYTGRDAAVAWNKTAKEYLVVWEGDDDTDFGDGPLVENDNEIFGQRLDAEGNEIGADFRISDMGQVDGDTGYSGLDPSVAWNASTNEYLVVWRGDDDTDFGSGPLVDGEFEVFGQRLDVEGKEIGVNDFRISDMGPDGDDGYDITDVPSVAWNSAANEYLVVWYGSDDRDFGNGPLDEKELFGQRLDAEGMEIGTNDFRISDMGAIDGDLTYTATQPAVAWNATANEYLVVWAGDDDTDFGNGPLADNEFEVFGQRLDAEGNEVGVNDFRISDMGATDGDEDYDPREPQVSWNAVRNEYLVVWEGDDDTDFGSGPLVARESEIFGQMLDAQGNEIGVNDFRISIMGPDGDPEFDAEDPFVTHNRVNDEYFVVWRGDTVFDGIAGPLLVDGEREVFGQRVDGATGALLETNLALPNIWLSDMGPSTETGYAAQAPAVVHNDTLDEYLVVWDGDDNTDFGNGPLADGELEVFGQRYAVPIAALRFREAPYIAHESDGNATITVERLGDAATEVTVDYATVSVTADATDHVPISGTLSFASGETELAFDVVFVDDDVDEAEEALTLTLSNAQASSGEVEIDQLSQGEAQLTIIDEDEIVTATPAAPTVTETGTPAATFMVSRSGREGEVSVDYATVDGTAFAGDDYVAASGTLTWADGDTSDRALTVDISDDSFDEGRENFSLVLSNITGGTIGTQSSATINITDEDETVEFTLAAISVDENSGGATVTVARTGSKGEVTVDYTTVDGTATAGDDYVATGGTLTWLDGDMANRSFTVSISDDVLDETSEIFSVALVNVNGALPGSTSTATVTISDNDNSSGGGAVGGGGASGGGGACGWMSVLLVFIAFIRRQRESRHAIRVGARTTALAACQYMSIAPK